MKTRALCLLLAVCLAIGLTACGNEQAVSATVSVTETVEMTETTGAATEPTAKEATVPEVVVGFLPTNKPWQYVAIEDQGAAVAAIDKAISAIYSDEWWIKGDRTTGLQVEYKGEIWTFVESGELVYPLGRIKAEDAADLLALCEEAAWAAGWKDALKPEQLTDFVSATVHRKGNQYQLTDSDGLDKLESMLSGSKYVLGGTGCPFSALLELTTQSGETMEISLATDGCGAWRSEGYYYEFGSDSQPLYDLFGVAVEELW